MTKLAGIVPGRAGTVKLGDLHTLMMGDGEGKPHKIVHNGMVKQYVGIGWVAEREATQEDADLYPVAVEERA